MRPPPSCAHFLARAGLDLVKPRGARDYRGTIADLPNVEVAYLSAAEIVELLAQGAVHVGLTGEDLVREMIPAADEHVVFIDGLGFGHANVAVAVTQAWIDVHNMADLDDVATAFRLAHERKMRVAPPLGGPTSSGMLTLHCPPKHVHGLSMLLRDKGAENVVVADLGYVFSRANPLYARLEAGLAPPA